MNQNTRNIILILLLMLSVFLVPALMGGSAIDELLEEDNFANGDDFLLINTLPVFWIRIPVHQMSVLFTSGISIFILFIVYLGGRSKHRRFNDRTIEAVNDLKADLFKTARIRAVFNFPFLDLHPQEVSSTLCKQ